MSQNEMYALAGAILVIVYLLADVLKYYALRDAIKPYADSLGLALDKFLAGYGKELKPANDVFNAAKTLIDEDSDALAKALPSDALRVLRDIADRAINLTDGK